MKLDNIINKHQVGELLGLHPITVSLMAREGKLPAAKVGNIWCFDKEQIVEWLKNKMKDNLK